MSSRDDGEAEVGEKLEDDDDDDDDDGFVFGEEEPVENDEENCRDEDGGGGAVGGGREGMPLEGSGEGRAAIPGRRRKRRRISARR